MAARAFLSGVIGSVALVGSGVLVRRYRRDIEAANTRVATVDRRVVQTAFGAVEYAERGAGSPLLVSHGIFHGCDGGLIAARGLERDRWIIAPSRFGYLGSALPADASGAAQADAFVALLDALDVDTVDVLGISAGTSAAVQVALRHPDRVDHLVISSGNLPGSSTAVAPPSWAKAFYSDPVMWALKVLARPALARMMGVPTGFPRTAEDERVVAEMIDSIFPIGPRVAGAVFDAYVSDPEITTYPLDAVAVPTLIVHAVDDPLASFDAAARAAERIPGAVLVALDSGGHLGLGQDDRTRDAIVGFLGDRAVV